MDPDAANTGIPFPSFLRPSLLETRIPKHGAVQDSHQGPRQQASETSPAEPILSESLVDSVPQHRTDVPLQLWQDEVCTEESLEQALQRAAFHLHKYGDIQQHRERQHGAATSSSSSRRAHQQHQPSKQSQALPPPLRPQQQQQQPPPLQYPHPPNTSPKQQDMFQLLPSQYQHQQVAKTKVPSVVDRGPQMYPGDLSASAVPRHSLGSCSSVAEPVLMSPACASPPLPPRPLFLDAATGRGTTSGHLKPPVSDGFGASKSSGGSARQPQLDETPDQHQHQLPTPLPSRGSIGHPTRCQLPCKYIRKRDGCRYGSDCTFCHLCEWRHLGRWQRGGSSEVASEMEGVPSYDPPGREHMKDVSTSCADLVAEYKKTIAQRGSDLIPSVGSIGHPFTCGPPCVFFASTSGCMKGFDCLWCHAPH
mmetsp:Transcript_36063/g.84551  ORF Transcript_36063/g.84551 Transcript_36063/m.84551 type:complete len:421 (+) Transcript_36063:90-1352(+)